MPTDKEVYARADKRLATIKAGGSLRRKKHSPAGKAHLAKKRAGKKIHPRHSPAGKKHLIVNPPKNYGTKAVDMRLKRSGLTDAEIRGEG